MPQEYCNPRARSNKERSAVMQRGIIKGGKGEEGIETGMRRQSEKK